MKAVKRERALKRKQAAEARYEPRVLRPRAERKAPEPRRQSTKKTSGSQKEQKAEVGDKRPATSEIEDGNDSQKVQKTS